MTKAVDIKKLYRDTDDYMGKEIVIQGWIRTLRDSKNFGFIEVNDGSFFKNRVFDSCIVKKSLKPLERLYFFVKFHISILSTFEPRVII